MNRTRCKKNIAGWNLHRFCLSQELLHNNGSLSLCQLALFPAVATRVDLIRRLLKPIDTIGRNEFPSLQPRVSMRNPRVYLCSTWSNTLASSSTFLERALLNKESSMISTLRRFSLVRGTFPADKRTCCERHSRMQP